MKKQRKFNLFFLAALVVLSAMIIGGCKRAVTPPFTQTPIEITITNTVSLPTTEAPYPPPTKPNPQKTQLPYPLASSTSYPAPLVTNTPAETHQPEPSPSQAAQTSTSTSTSIPEFPGTASPTPIKTEAYPAPRSSPTNQSYPGPRASATNEGYPGPRASTTKQASQGPNTPTPRLTRTPISTETPAQTVTETPIGSTPRATPTESLPQAPISPPPAGSSVTIWHSWGIAEVAVLQSIIDSFVRSYPDVTFTLVYVPEDELYQRYHDASYLGGGPSLLLGPSSWGPGLAQEALVLDLKPYISAGSIKDINPAAFDSGKYRDMQVSLPLAQKGVVIFRNTSLITNVPDTFDEFTATAQEATHGGIVGSYLERGANISAADIIGLGGELMDAEGMPAFDTQFGRAWMELLANYDVAGAVTFNTNRDIDMFKRGRVGMIIDGTWNIPALSQSIGLDHLAIDPWPTYGTGHLSSWVSADSVYVNSNVTNDNMMAALNFIGYLLDPNVQLRLAEVGHIPAVNTTQPRDPLIRQAMEAFMNGVPYPNIVENDILDVYWKELDLAINNVFLNGMDSSAALKQASNNIAQFIIEKQSIP